MLVHTSALDIGASPGTVSPCITRCGCTETAPCILAGAAEYRIYLHIAVIALWMWPWNLVQNCTEFLLCLICLTNPFRTTAEWVWSSPCRSCVSFVRDHVAVSSAYCNQINCLKQEKKRPCVTICWGALLITKVGAFLTRIGTRY